MGPRDEVIVQSFVFCVSLHLIMYVVAISVFVDSEAETWNMEPDLLEKVIKNRIPRQVKI